ncbi:WD40-repeat-containing domain protein [Dunaliella salina]|uniref:WD40-repeat-containing domain protein n=1 Tax=Dunaliella salina TaxID=3046 RepID=A0ABQ7GQI3_DUNSA|nr:WD40-repeat-containing domain protein [Dunaliella salina]|eukprot:KAF5836870.1 WD40-repeat-containing domain protein [Dunaliella salina]
MTDTFLVSCVSARGPHLYVCAGTDLLVHDIETAKPVRRLCSQDGSSVLCVKASQNGRIVFTGSTDGAVRMHDLRVRGDGGHTLWQHAAAVQDLSFEDPWLASIASDGTLAILDTESSAPGSDVRGTRGSSRASSNSSSRDSAGIRGGISGSGRAGLGGGSSISGSGAGGRAGVRQLQAGCGTAYSVHLAEQWLVCGGASNVVRVWDFRGAHHHGERVAAAKVARLASKEARQLAQQERQAQRLQAQLARQQQQQEQQQQQQAVEQEQIRMYMQGQQQQQQQRGQEEDHQGRCESASSSNLEHHLQCEPEEL